MRDYKFKESKKAVRSNIFALAARINERSTQQQNGVKIGRLHVNFYTEKPVREIAAVQ